MRALALALLAALAAQAQPDSLLAPPIVVAPPTAAVAAPPAADSVEARTSRGAVTRALLAPGLGQVYNRQPLKAPIATALVVGSVAYAINRQRQYLRFRRATVFAGCRADPGFTVDEGGVETVTDLERVKLCTETAPDYEDEWLALGSPAFSAIGGVGGPRDRARGQRDVGVLIVAVAYAFQALDAYVAAELADFDVSEDVALGLDADPRAPGLSLTVRL